MIKRVGSLQELKNIHNDDKKKFTLNGVNFFACTTNPLIFITKEGEKIVTNEWLVNNGGELIYNIKKNKWVNMKMYESDISTVTNDIYYFKGQTNEADNVKVRNTLRFFKASVESTQIAAKSHLVNQSDYGSYHGGVNNTCQDVLFWIAQLEKEQANENR